MTEGIANKILKIDQSLSYTIDKALDNELQQDVQFNYRQWVSVFDIIKEDNATNQKQYSGGDTDIRNGKNYVVKQGQEYQITQNTWNKILNIAKQAIGQSDNENNNKKVEVESVAKNSDTKLNEENLRAILEEAELNVTDEEFVDILAKYENKLALKDSLKFTDESIKQDIVDYVKGKQYERAEDTFAKADKPFALLDEYALAEEDINELKEAIKADHPEYDDRQVQQAVSDILNNDNGMQQKAKVETYYNNLIAQAQQAPYIIEGVEEATNKKDYKAHSEAYKRFGNSQVQLYDTNGDNKIDLQEFLGYEAKRLGENGFNDVEKDIAEKMFNELKNISTDDDYIDEQEMTLHGYAMSKISDSDKKKSGKDITFEEWKMTNDTLLGHVMDNEEANEVYNRYKQIQKTGYDVIYNYEEILKQQNMNK